MHAKMSPCMPVLAGFLSTLLTATVAAQGQYGNASRCFYLPTDPQWPSNDQWNALNKTVGGALIRGAPLAKPCYGPNIDAARCSVLRNEWNGQDLFIVDPVNVMSGYFQNNSCSPFLAPNGGCVLGNLAQYAVAVSGANSVVASIKFARAQNIRLIVKNTGHDALGRSTGKGSLALWTHNLKSISFNPNYRGSTYSGPAATFAAGVSVSEAYTAASAKGYRVAGGGCPTVGVSGGWVQGGGHGPLASAYGLGADNALEYEVVTLDGQHTTASPSQNSDLYWALSGGGAGTYAIVLSTTMRAHRDGPVVGSGFSFTNTNPDSFWAAIEAWMRSLLVIEEKFPTFKTTASFSNQFFQLSSATLPDASNTSQLDAILRPFFSQLASLNISLASNTTIASPSFVEHYNAFNSTYTGNVTIGSRLIPRALVQDSKRLPQLMTTVRGIATSNNASLFVIVAANVSTARVGIKPSANSVLPAWRDAAFLLSFGILQSVGAGLSELQSTQDTTQRYQEQFRALTPGGGSYQNEGTFNNPNWKTDYYGVNYDRLLSIKRKYDPDNMLWGNVNVGGDLRKLDADGRLCRA